MKRTTSLLLALVMCFGMVINVFAASGDVADLIEEQLQIIEEQSQKNKINTILTTDGEPDDMNSMLRYLTYANEFNTKAIVLTTSQSHWSGGTIIDPETGEPVEYDPAIHDTTVSTNTTPVGSAKSVDNTPYLDPFMYDPTPENPDSGDEYMALRYKQYRFTGFGWMNLYLDAYEECYDNLVAYDPDYPTREYLESILAVGNIKYTDEMLEITEGSELIKNTILENPDGEALLVQAWGGTSTLARALKSIEEEYKDTAEWDALYEKISSELSCYMINTQDQTYAMYISQNWPDITILHSGISFLVYVRMTGTYDGWWSTLNDIGSPLLDEYLTSGGDWSLLNIGVDTTNPYYTWRDSERTSGFYDPSVNSYNAFAGDAPIIETWGEREGDSSGNPGTGPIGTYSEGDTPAFLYLIDVGLRSLEDPSWGGWGGLFTPSASNTNAYNGSSNELTRWAPDVQTDYSARAQWTVRTDANVAPRTGVMQGLDLTAAVGETITINGVAYDPNGDELSYNWWQHSTVDTYRGASDGALSMENADTKDLTITIPEDAELGDTIHLIFEVQDDAELPMKAYKRVVITVGEPEDEDSAITLNTTAHNVQAGDFIPVYASFKEEQPSNTVILNFTFDSEKFAYNGYSVDGVNNVKLVDYQSGEGWAKITLMAQNYDAKDLGYLGLRAKENAPLIRERQYVNVTADYVLRDEDDNKSVADTKTKVSFTTIGDGEGGPGLPGDTNDDGVVDIMDLSNMIDWFGYTPENQADWDDWHTYFDFNNNNEIDISDIAYVARLI